MAFSGRRKDRPHNCNRAMLPLQRMPYATTCMCVQTQKINAVLQTLFLPCSMTSLPHKHMHQKGIMLKDLHHGECMVRIKFCKVHSGYNAKKRLDR